MHYVLRHYYIFVLLYICYILSAKLQKHATNNLGPICNFKIEYLINIYLLIILSNSFVQFYLSTVYIYLSFKI